jgi:hypothetical protein
MFAKLGKDLHKRINQEARITQNNESETQLIIMPEVLYKALTFMFIYIRALLYQVHRDFRQMRSLLQPVKRGRCEREQSWIILRFCPSIHLERLWNLRVNFRSQ